MKHQKIELAPPLDRLIVEVSKKMKKQIFQLFLRFQGHFLILRKSHFFQEPSISTCRPHDIRNPLIESNKKKKKLKVLPHCSLSLGAPYTIIFFIYAVFCFDWCINSFFSAVQKHLYITQTNKINEYIRAEKILSRIDP